MKIGIDISQIAYEGTGVATYTRLLVEALLRNDKHDEFVLFASSLRNRKPIKNFVKGLEAKNVKVKFSFLPLKILEILFNGIHLIPIENFIGDVDVFHSSDWLEPPTRSAKRVTTIHDFTVYKYPETFSQRGGHDIVTNQKRKLFFVKNYSDRIIAVTQTTKNDAIEILKIPEKKISVVYEAADPFYYKREKIGTIRVKEKYQVEGRYILCVGTREPRKNLDRAIMAFAELTSKFPDLNLLIAGKYGWGEDSAKLKVQSAKLTEKVKILGFVEKEDLACLYSGAETLVYPSLYEGFGLPILDAMACGCPVITSDRGSMKEISGEAAVLIDPVSVKSISGAIAKICTDSNFRTKLSQQSLKKSGEFSWDKTALQTLEVYRTILE